MLFTFLLFALQFNLKFNGNNYTISYKEIEKKLYFNLQNIGFLEITRFLPENRFVIKYKEKEAEIIPENNWIKINEKIINMVLPPKFINDTIWVWEELLNELFIEFLNKRLEIKEGQILLEDMHRKIKKIVIDPGHGGKDPGAIGPIGTNEKDIVLNIAKLLKEIIEKELGIECILTREKDEFVSLKTRSMIANKADADLFVSIHCNAGKRKSANGTEVYFLSPAKTDWERAVAARENASIEYEEKVVRDEYESILWDLAQTQFLKESNTLAGMVVKEITNETKNENRGVKQAGFYVLYNVYMPSCLIEVDFITNKNIEKKLNKKTFLLLIAKGIANGIKKFKEYYETYQY